MAFFGLTMLGPQDPWKVPKFPDVSTVAKDDFLSAFRRVAGGEGCIVLSQIKDVLKVALDMGVDPLESDVRTFEALLQDQPVIDQVAFEAALVKMYAAAPHKPTSEYRSFKTLRNDVVRNRRMMGDPHEKFQAPMTSAQEILKRMIAPSGRMFYHRPSNMSFYGEAMFCYEEGKDFAAGPTLKAMEKGDLS